MQFRAYPPRYCRDNILIDFYEYPNFHEYPTENVTWNTKSKFGTESHTDLFFLSGMTQFLTNFTKFALIAFR